MTQQKKRNINNILKNTWKEYKAGEIPGTIPNFWEKSGINSMAKNLKNIKKNSKKD